MGCAFGPRIKDPDKKDIKKKAKNSQNASSRTLNPSTIQTLLNLHGGPLVLESTILFKKKILAGKGCRKIRYFGIESVHNVESDRCSVLQRVAVCYGVLQCVAGFSQIGIFGMRLFGVRLRPCFYALCI